MNKNILELGALVLAVIFFILIYFLKKKNKLIWKNLGNNLGKNIK